MAELSMTALADAILVIGIALTVARSGGGSLEYQAIPQGSWVMSHRAGCAVWPGIMRLSMAVSLVTVAVGGQAMRQRCRVSGLALQCVHDGRGVAGAR